MSFLIKLLKTSILEKRINFSLFLLRIGISLLMLTHGWPKFQKTLAGDWTFGDPLGVGAGPSLLLATGAEFIGSILLILGLLTRFAVVPLMVTMIVAVVVVHADDPFPRKELGLLYLIPYIVILINGPGSYSLDHYLFQPKK